MADNTESKMSVAEETVVATPDSSSGFVVPGWAIYVILALTALTYARGLSNGLTTFDDDFYIINNPFLKDFSLKGVGKIFSSIYMGNYHPFTTLTFLVEYRLFGEQPFIYHLVNVLLHLACTWMAFKVTAQLSRQKITPLIVAFLFGLHPMHVESVAWVSERKDVLYGFYYLLAIWAYLKFLDEGQSRKMYLLTLLFFVVSLCSKSAAVTLPVLMLALDFYRDRPITSKVLVEKVPFFILSLVFGAVNVYAQAKAGAIVDMEYSAINTFFLFVSGPAFYITKLFAPFGLSILHAYPELNGTMLPLQYYLSVPLLALVVWFAVKGAGRFKKVVVFGLAFFLICVSVMLQIISVGAALTSERYTYIGYIGLFYILGQYISSALLTKHRDAVLVVVCVYCCIFSVITWNRIAVWKDSELVLSDIINNNPQARDISAFYFLRGTNRVKNQMLPEAIADFSRAIEQRPIYFEAFDNRGVAYSQLGKSDSAMSDFTAAINLSTLNPRPFYNRGIIKATNGDIEGALEDMNEFLLRVPRNGKAHVDRGMMRLELKDTAGGCEDLQEALKLGSEEAASLLKQVCK